MTAFNSAPLQNQKVMILGGSGAMGSAAAEQLTALGASVILVGRSQQRLHSIAERLGTKASTEVADVSDEAQLDQLFQRVGSLDAIVVAVSANTSASSIGETSTKAAASAFSKFWTSYTVLHRAPRVLAKDGSITLLSGSSARTPAHGYGVWTTVHGSIEALARGAA
ncbi:MAG: SDR family oxidoreductase, partial [Myxococcota bacterium]